MIDERITVAMADRDRNTRGEFLPTEGAKRKMVSTRLSDEEFERFEAAIAQSGEQKTLLIRRLVMDWVEQQESQSKKQIAA